MGTADNMERTGRRTPNAGRRNPNLSTVRETVNNDELNAWNSNPRLNAVVDAGQGQGVTNWGAFANAASDYITGVKPTGLPPAAPTRPNGGSTSGGGSGGLDAKKLAAAKAAIQSLYQMYNLPPDTALATQLNTIAGQAQATADTAMNNLRQSLNSYQAPAIPTVQATPVAANPLAAYMAAGGVDSSGTEALRSMLQSTNAQTAQAQNAMGAAQQASYQQMQNERMQDVAMSETAFKQQLANNQAAMQFQLAQQEKKRKEEMMMNILQMAVSNGVDLGSVGVKF